VASGAESHAEGMQTTASAIAAHAEGENSQATNTAAHAEGYQTTSTNIGSHSEGYVTTASGYSAHAEGYNGSASGDYSHSEGQQTTASGRAAHAEGQQTTATNTGAHAEGYVTTAAGSAAHAEGYSTVAIGDYSHAGGYNTNASGQSSHVIGHSGTDRGIMCTQIMGIQQAFSLGQAQYGHYGLGGSTVDGATAIVLTVDGNSPTQYNQLALPNGAFGAQGATYAFNGKIIGVDPASNNKVMLIFNGVISQGATPASTILDQVVAQIQTSPPGLQYGTIWDLDNYGFSFISPAWSGLLNPKITFSADTTFGALQVSVIGIAATTIKWLCDIQTTEVTY